MSSRRASLRPIVVAGGARGGDDAPPVRFATVSDQYGPFGEDSMELLEERAYQRGMMEHLRENVDGLKRLDVGLHHDDDGVPQFETAANYSNQGEEGEAVEVGSDDGQELADWRGGVGLQRQEVGSFILYRPKPTYYELRQKQITARPLAAPPVTHARWLNPPKTYRESWVEGTEESNHTHSVNHHHHRYPDGWIQQGSLDHPVLGIDGPWDRYQQHGMLDNRGGAYGANCSHELNSSRAPLILPLSPPLPPPAHPLSVASESVSILLPLHSTALPTQGYYGGYHGNGLNDRNLGNANPGSFSVDINVNVLPGAIGQGQRVQTIHDNPELTGTPRTLVPPLDLSRPSALPQQPYQVKTTAHAL